MGEFIDPFNPTHVRRANFAIRACLGSDPVLKYPQGKPLCEMSVAYSYPGSTNTIWYRLVAWNELAVTLAQMYKKGDWITVLRSLPSFDTYKCKCGAKFIIPKYTIYEVAAEMEIPDCPDYMLPGGKNGGDDGLPY